MKRLWVLLLCLLLAASLAGCAWEPMDESAGEDTTADAQSFEFTVDNYPRMGGSLAVLPLGEAITAAALGVSREETAQWITFEGSTSWNYQMLVDGNYDILLAYEPSQQAIEYAESQGFTWEMTPIGRDALVFIANAENPVDEVSSEQITGIYTGEITNWSELGGENMEIIPYQRNSDSGSQTLFDLFFPLGDALMEPPQEYVVGSMVGLLEVIADYDNSAAALGYTVYYYLTNMETDKLSRSKILAVDGVEANNDTIQSGEYPYCNDFYVVIPADLPEDDPARILYHWICGEQVRELGERENYVMLQ